MQSEEVCPGCGGSGRIQNLPCSICHGAGRVPREKRLEVKIPAGVATGSRIRFAGQGGPGYRGGQNGDLYLIVNVISHPIFERKGDDLYQTLDIPLMTAVLGGEVRVPTITGNVILKVPPETQNGKVFNLKGKGMPRMGDSVYGDLLAKVNVVLPAHLTPEEKNLYEQLRKLRGGGA
jgi:DnaJ-class molecular chaperone